MIIILRYSVSDIRLTIFKTVIYFCFSAVIPVAAATMTPIPLLFGLIVMKIRQYWLKRNGQYDETPVDQDEVKESESNQKLMINGLANNLGDSNPKLVMVNGNGNIGEPNGHV